MAPLLLRIRSGSFSFPSGSVCFSKLFLLLKGLFKKLFTIPDLSLRCQALGDSKYHRYNS